MGRPVDDIASVGVDNLLNRRLEMHNNKIFFLLDGKWEVIFPRVVEKQLLGLRWGFHYFLNPICLITGLACGLYVRFG